MQGQLRYTQRPLVNEQCFLPSMYLKIVEHFIKKNYDKNFAPQGYLSGCCLSAWIIFFCFNDRFNINGIVNLWHETNRIHDGTGAPKNLVF